MEISWVGRSTKQNPEQATLLVSDPAMVGGQSHGWWVVGCGQMVDRAMDGGAWRRPIASKPGNLMESLRQPPEGLICLILLFFFFFKVLNISYYPGITIPSQSQCYIPLRWCFWIKLFHIVCNHFSQLSATLTIAFYVFLGRHDTQNLQN